MAGVRVMAMYLARTLLIRNRKTGGTGPPGQVSPLKLTYLYRPVSACGLSVVRGERTRPV